MAETTLVPSPNDLAFAKAILDQGLVNPADLQECFSIQRQESTAGIHRRKVKDILLERGLLGPDKVHELANLPGSSVAPERFGPYAIVSFIARGGMGTVCRATHLMSGEWVALKIMAESVSRDAELLARFRREASINLRLNHPNIVRTLEMGELRGKQFIAMELIDGEDLSQVLAQRKALSEKEALAIVHSVALALEYAHEMGLVHRDVKPGNILFTRTGQIKLADFGLVKDTDPQVTVQTRTGQILGTPNYISPEQARGEPIIDHRSDIYSLGATLYHMVTGQPPFSSSSPLTLLAKHMNEDPTPPRTISKNLSSYCELIISRMMAKNREDRYQTPRNLVEDIECVLAGKRPPYSTVKDGNPATLVLRDRQDFDPRSPSRDKKTAKTVNKQNGASRRPSLILAHAFLCIGITTFIWGLCFFFYLTLDPYKQSISSLCLGTLAGGVPSLAIGFAIGWYIRNRSCN